MKPWTQIFSALCLQPLRAARWIIIKGKKKEKQFHSQPMPWFCHTATFEAITTLLDIQTKQPKRISLTHAHQHPHLLKHCASFLFLSSLSSLFFVLFFSLTFSVSNQVYQHHYPSPQSPYAIWVSVFFVVCANFPMIGGLLTRDHHHHLLSLNPTLDPPPSLSLPQPCHTHSLSSSISRDFIISDKTP